jgi:hypothetical protein
MDIKGNKFKFIYAAVFIFCMSGYVSSNEGAGKCREAVSCPVQAKETRKEDKALLPDEDAIPEHCPFLRALYVQQRTNNFKQAAILQYSLQIESI